MLRTAQLLALSSALFAASILPAAGCLDSTSEATRGGPNSVDSAGSGASDASGPMADSRGASPYDDVIGGDAISSRDDTADTEAPRPDDTGPSVCITAGETCEGHGDCCDGFCGDIGYGPKYCRPQISDGRWCPEDAACLSGRCSDGVCVGACGDVGGECWRGQDCCTGVCAGDPSGPYAPGSCIDRQPDGQPCQGDGGCLNGSCTDGICGAPSCLAISAECWGGADCCSGACSYDWSNPYVAGACIAPRPSGSACGRDDQCASGACGDGICG